MDLIHADGDFNELGFVDFIRYDGVISFNPEIEDNDWEAQILAQDFGQLGIRTGHYLYFPNTEWGGRVEKIEHISSSGIIKLSGLTWRGMLICKVVSPPAGKSHLDLRDAALEAAIEQLVSGFDGLFVMDSGNVSGCQCGKKFRYQNVLEGITDTLDALGRRLEIELDGDNRRIVLRTRKTHDRSDEIEFSGDYDFSYTSTLAEAQFNHVIALGKGEQENRTVKHVYLLPDGSTTTDSSVKGVAQGADERALVYDYSNCEDEDELISGAKKRLLEYAKQNTIEFNADSPDLDLPLGDRVGIRDRIMNMSAVKTISRKLLMISEDGATLQYSVE